MSHSKQAKIPELTEDTKILCFDLETNALHGQTFAIGALIVDASGKIHDEFTARVAIKGEIDDWVTGNVLPVIEDMEITHGTYEAMRESFWRWFVVAQEKSDYVLVSNGYPVEYRFLLDCQDADIEERYWQHPFPIIDLTSMLLLLQKTHNIDKKTLSLQVQQNMVYRVHHPLDDAKKAALMAFEAIKVSGTK